MRGVTRRLVTDGHNYPFAGTTDTGRCHSSRTAPASRRCYRTACISACRSAALASTFAVRLASPSVLSCFRCRTNVVHLHSLDTNCPAGLLVAPFERAIFYVFERIVRAGMDQFVAAVRTRRWYAVPIHAAAALPVAPTTLTAADDPLTPPAVLMDHVVLGHLCNAHLAAFNELRCVAAMSHWIAWYSSLTRRVARVMFCYHHHAGMWPR